MTEKNKINEMMLELPNVVAVFEAQVKRFGKLPAVSFKGEVWSYEDVNNYANQIAMALTAGGLERGGKVVIDANSKQWFIVGILAILKAGGAYVPLDPEFPQARLEFMIEDTEAKFLLSETNSSLRRQFSQRDQIMLDKEYESKKTTKNLGIKVSDQDLAYVMYTSGSTGEPKGVEILHRGIVHLVCHADYVHLGRDQIHLSLAPNGFDAATFEIWAPLLNGGVCVIFPNDPFSLEGLETVIRIEKVTTLWLTSSLFNIVVQQQPNALRTIKQLLVGGEVLSLTHIRKMKVLLPDTQLINGYGPTEATTFACCHTITAADLTDDEVIPIGRPINRAYMRILDASGNQVATGEVGELCLGGPGLARGYLNKPALTKEKFILDPFSDNNEQYRLYRTGDLVRMRHDNNIEYVGREDLQVKIRGHRIEPGEIEAVLKKETPFINSAVVAFQTRTKDYALAAFMEPVEHLDVETARDILKRVLPSYLIPANFELINKLPLTASGKIDRAALSRKMEQVHSPPETVSLAPLTETEEKVAKIWAKILDLPTLKSTDHFFQIGGNSLLAIRMIAMVRSRLQTSASVASVFQNPTLGQFTARLIFDDASHELSVDTAEEGAVDTGLNYGQRQIWIEHNNSVAKTAYNILCTIHIQGKLDVDVLKQGLSIIVGRHSMLRTGFVPHGSRILPVLTESSDLQFVEEDCHCNDPQQIADYIADKINVEANHVFSLMDAKPPYRMSFLYVKEQHAVLLLNFHHILVDEWSLEIFFGELAEIYRALNNASLHYTPAEFTSHEDDFRRWQNRFLKSAEYCRQLDYWREALADLSPEISLPRKPSLQAPSEGALARADLFISSETIGRLEEFARVHGTTLFNVFLSVYALTLARISGQSDLSIGTPVSLRDQTDLQTQIGYFLNTVVIRATLAQEDTFVAFLAHMHLTLTEALRHKDVPLECLVAEFEPIRDCAGRPFFQTLFAIQRGFENERLIPDADTSIHFHASNRCKIDLALQFVTSDEGYSGHFDYDPSIFEPETIFELRSVFEAFIRCLDHGETVRMDFLNSLQKIRPILKNKENVSTLVQENIQDADDLKIALMRCWQKCLRLTSFDPNASFFDLGGNSILALQLVAEIEKSTGLHLDLPSIFTQKTFAALLEHCHESSATSGDLVVSLRKGSRPSTVFCIHGVTYYQDLAEVIPADYPVVGLMSHSHQELINTVSRNAQKSVDIPLLVDQYYAKVRELQSEGPYYLVGHSFGGLLAFEIASRLQKEGAVVERLILVDVLLPGSYHPPWLQKFIKLHVYAKNNMWSELRDYVYGGVGRKLQAFKDTNLGVKIQPVPHHNTVISKKVSARYQDAMHQYQPSNKHYNGRVVLVRANETRSIHALKDDFGWQEVLESPLEYVDVPGDHLSCVSQPNLDALAKFFRNSAVFDRTPHS